MAHKTFKQEVICSGFRVHTKSLCSLILSPVTLTLFFFFFFPHPPRQPGLWDALPSICVIQGCQNEECEGICEYHRWLQNPSASFLSSVYCSTLKMSSPRLLSTVFSSTDELFLACVGQPVNSVEQNRRTFFFLASGCRACCPLKFK